MRKLLWFLLLPVQVFATNFYVSNSGSDAAAGTIGAPWASIAKVNASMASFMPGDSVLFQRGGDFFGALTISKAGVIIGAYGSGAAPVITGFKTLIGWTSAGTNLWSAATASPKAYMNVVAINGVMVREGRFPDYADNASSWLTYTNSLPTSSPVNVISGSAIPTSFVGGELVLRKNSYNLDVMPITGQSGNTFTCTNAPGIYGVVGGLGGYGFFVQNHPATLTSANEWYFNPTTRALTIFSSASPTATIRGSVFDTVVNVTAGNVTIENLNIQGGNSFGVFSSGSGLVLKNNIIRFVGYWGVQINGASSTIANNIIRDIGSNGIWMANSGLIEGNQVRAISNLDGMGGNQDDQGLGIAIQTSAGVLCRRNIVDSISYNGIKFSGGNITIRENVVSNVCINKNDGGAIYTWENNGTWNFPNKVVSRNIIINVGKILFGMPASYSTGYYPLYMDGGTGAVTLDSNVIALSNVSQNSTFTSSNIFDDHAVLMNNPRSLIFRNNITFGYPTGLSINDWSPSITVTPKPTGNIITGNALYVNNMANGNNWKETNRSFFWQSHGARSIAEQQVDIQNIGTMNNNYVADFAQSPFHWTSYSADGAFPVKLAGWQAFSGKDLNSVSFPATTPEFQYNATATPTTYTFTGRQKRDYRGNIYNNSATIPAYYGNIFFDNGPATTPTALTVTATPTAIACNGGNSTVTVTASGGTAPYTGTGTFTRTAGTHTFSVTDAVANSGSATITITQPSALVVTASAGTISTPGGSTNVVISASGGTAPYSGTGTFSRTAGVHTFTVTDNNGCVSTAIVSLSNPVVVPAQSIILNNTRIINGN